MSGTPTLTAIGAVTISATDADIESIFKGAAASIATIPAANKFTYNGNTLPQGDGQSVLFVPASVVGNVTIPAGYGYVVVGQGSQVNLFTADDPQYHHATIVGDGYNFQGRASVVANGGGVSNVTATNDFNSSSGSPGSDAIHVAGTGTLVGGFNSSFIIDAGAHATVNATYTTHSANAVTVEGGATATVRETSGSLQILAGAMTNVTLGELGSNTVNIGFNPGVAPTVPGSVPTVPSATAAIHNAGATPAFTNVINATGPSNLPIYKEAANRFTINDASSVNLIALGLLDRVDAFAGISTIFGRAANTINVGAGSVFFVGGADTVSAMSDLVPPSDASTIHGGTANSTVFATANDRFDLGSSQANVFVGGSGASTINALTGGGLFFGGTHGDDYNSGTSAAQTFVGLGGADTINSAGGTVAPLLYALNGERMQVVGGAATTVVGFTQGGVVDVSRTSGNNDLFAGYGDSGNETLVGATASVDSTGAAIHDTFVVGVNPNATAATITVDNWHAGDVFFLTGFGPADIATMDAAISNGLGASSLTFTLSDKTTINFVGNHPTNFSGGAAF